ncbi:molybdenum cofactor biosynthesis protein MoaE [Methanolobus chelungpuianus]|uniref:molybdenum cofactor biosynthesis protein MoaE n=1 Tax=Methanolobus chelungpuianus TaxID=502115 RepID=UPI002113B3DD
MTKDDFDVASMIEQAKKPASGAIVTFLGIVRDDDIERIELEVYEEAALKFLEEIKDVAMQDYAIESVDIVHRYGPLNIGDNIVLITVSAGHRREAFSACEFIIEQIKEKVPIWKKEVGKDFERWK